MNLEARHFPLILLGAALGVGIGWLASLFLSPGTFPQLEKAVGLHGVGRLFGGVCGAALTVLLLLFRSVRDPSAEPSRNFTTINGIGSRLLGKKDQRPDGSYVATEWFTVFYVPVFPIARYRVTPISPRSIAYQEYTIHEKHPPRMSDVLKVYAVMGVLAALIATAVHLLR